MIPISMFSIVSCVNMVAKRKNVNAISDCGLSGKFSRLANSPRDKRY